MDSPSLERFKALDRIEGLFHGLTLRAPGLDVAVDKEKALERLEAHYRAAIGELGFSWEGLVTGEQVHGAEIAVVDGNTDVSRPLPGVDGLICGEAGPLLGIHVADCCAVYLVDSEKGCFGLVHSGKKGSELGIVLRAIAMMESVFGARATDMCVQLSPCIRPPDYEIDFAARIREQCAESGVPEASVYDAMTSTALDLERYYSYRAEKGKTGRMLALMGRRD